MKRSITFSYWTGSLEEELFLKQEERGLGRDGGGVFGPSALSMNSNNNGQDSGNDYLVTKKVVLKFTIGGQPIGDVGIGLFGNTVPKTVANFVALADHEVCWWCIVFMGVKVETNF